MKLQKKKKKKNPFQTEQAGEIDTLKSIHVVEGCWGKKERKPELLIVRRRETSAVWFCLLCSDFQKPS